MKKRTLVNHPPSTLPPVGNRAVIAPIYQSVKYEFDTVDDALAVFRGERPGYFYMRSSNPTTRQLELTLAALQGRADCLATASGVNAVIQTLLALTKQGDHIVVFVESYPPTRAIARRFLARFGVEHTMLSIEDLDSLERVLATRPTRLVLFESPTNPMLKVADIERIVSLAHRHGALAVLDNTFAGFHQHGQYEVDVFVHSLTKYASGAGDVMGGAAIASKELIAEMRREFELLGALLDPHAAFLLQRSLKTYFLRYREQCVSALAIASWLEQQSAVAAVRYPGLASHPQASLAARQMSDMGSVITFRLRAGDDAGARFTEALQLFAMTASLGSAESLVLPPQMLGGKDLTAAEYAASGLAPGTIRFSIGLEDVDDLIADLEQALGKI
ncbi:MAG: PLP-dependent aspartate aminotransferase family protein [Steroidobacteraceae bacterium]|jgi:cystathionine beta-lyase/cystathionine gamma-synthase